MHISIPQENTMEYINVTEVSPLISKCNVKVCYVSDEPNRNRTVITKALAQEMGKKLPGSPVVGYYNEETKDFDTHTRELEVKNGTFRLIDMTKPYGFVPTDAKVWFQKFLDDGNVEHEYLCTECYLWTEAYPEAQRVIEHGNNQSMELSKKSQSGFWAETDNSQSRIFIYNEALIEKLCILGENIEPCFEGAQIKSQFSLEDNETIKELMTNMYSMMAELQDTLNKGGSQTLMEDIKDVTLVEEPEVEFASKEDEEKKEDEKKTSSTEAPAEEKDEKEETPADEEEKKEKYNLEEVVEYVELKTQYDELQGKYSALEQEHVSLIAEVESLKEFKLKAERKDKQSMIDSFYMLTDEDKQEVVTNIDTYSLDDIEAKLSVICVRNKVNFNLEEQEDAGSQPQGLFSLNDLEDNDTAPAWVKAVRETANEI